MTYNPDGLDQLLTDMNWHDSQLEKSLTAFDRDQAALLRSDGTRLYSDDEHTQRMKALAERVQEAAGKAQERVLKAQEVAAVEVGAVNTDPSKWLSATDLATANARAPFVKEDVDILRLDHLAARLEQVLSERDAVSAWLYARYVPARLNRGVEAPKMGSKIEYGRVADLLRDIETLAMPDAVRQRAAKAKQLKERAMDVSIKAHNVVNAANGGRERAHQAMVEELRGYF